MELVVFNSSIEKLLLTAHNLLVGCRRLGCLPSLNASWHSDKLFSVSYSACDVKAGLFIHIYRGDNNWLKQLVPGMSFHELLGRTFGKLIPFRKKVF